MSEGFKAISSLRDCEVKQSSLHKHCRWHITLHTMRDLFPPSQLACNVIWWRYWFYFCTSLIFDIQLIASCRVAYSYVSRILSLYMTRLRVIYMTWLRVMLVEHYSQTLFCIPSLVKAGHRDGAAKFFFSLSTRDRITAQKLGLGQVELVCLMNV